MGNQNCRYLKCVVTQMKFWVFKIAGMKNSGYLKCWCVYLLKNVVSNQIWWSFRMVGT